MNPLDREYDLVGQLAKTKDGGVGIRIFHDKMLWPTLRRLFAPGGEAIELDIRIKPMRHSRSNSQNRYLHGVVVVAVQEWMLQTQGEKIKAPLVYAWIKEKLLGQTPKVTTVMGTEVIIFEELSFSKMNTKEFADAVDLIRAKMLELGCDIPEPTTNNHLHEHLK